MNKETYKYKINKHIKSAIKLELYHDKYIDYILKDISNEHGIDYQELVQKYLYNENSDKNDNENENDNDNDGEIISAILIKKKINGIIYYLDTENDKIYNSDAKHVGSINGTNYVFT
jgi:hypothetical protein